jgi:transcriptional regulator with GAF, ATPase, and Fis domain
LEPIPESVEAMVERDAAFDDDTLLDQLRGVSEQVQELVPDCIGMSVALLEDDIVLTLVATEAEIAVLDAMQYLGNGPCVRGAETGEVVELNGSELLDEERWRIFARASAASAVVSTLTLPIMSESKVVGSVNLYAGSAQAFTGLHQELARALNAWAPGAVTNADLSWSTRAQAQEMPRKLRERARFDTAVGLLAAREELTIEEAGQRLLDAARRAGVSLTRIVQAVIAHYGHR